MSALRVFAGLVLLLAGVASATAQVKSVAPDQNGMSGYRIVRTLALGGKGKWDGMIVDAATRRLYLARDTHIAVLNVDTGATLGEVSGLQGVHSLALAQDLGRGFAGNSRSNTVTVFDLKTFTKLASVNVGISSDTVAYDSFTKTIFSMNLANHTVAAINAESGALRGTIRLVDSPDYAVADGKGNLYVNLADPAEIAVIDTAKLTLRRRILLAPCQESRGVALDVQHGKLFVGCSNEIMVVADVASGRMLAKLPTDGQTGSVVFDPDQQLAFVANGEGTVTVVRECSRDRFQVVENIKTMRGARTMALDTETHRIFLPTAVFHASAQIEELRLMEPNLFLILIAGR